MKFFWPCFAFMLAFFSACQLRHGVEDVSNQDPYRTSVGQKFVLQRDLYIYKFNDSAALRLGTAGDMPPYSIGVPQDVSSEHTGLKTDYLTILGVAEKGQTFTIKKVEYKKDYYFPSISYIVVLDNNLLFREKELATLQLVNLKNNPPQTKGFSTPPIFQPDMALPLASDGEWWK